MGPVETVKCEFQIGDVLELITSEGGDYGRKGDHLLVTELALRTWSGNQVLVTGTLIDGPHKGMNCGRFAKRYKLHSKREWD